MTSKEKILETLVYSPFNNLTDDKQREGPRNVGILAIQPPD